tara:strand:- start:43887 stop:45869 length:1983 start_codon:yes stop_codon:yes gene_type:complete
MDSLANSLLLLTKTNSKIVDKIKEADAKIDSVIISSTQSPKITDVEGKASNKSKITSGKDKTVNPSVKVKADVIDKKIVSTVEKPKTVIISDFTKEALTDLTGILGKRPASKETVDSGEPPKKSKTAMKVIGYLAAAAGSYAIIKNFKIENIPGLITGLQKARKSVTKLTDKMKTGVDKMKNGAKNIKSFFTKSKDAVKNMIPKNLKASVTKSVDAAKGAVKNLGSKIGSVADDAVSGLKSQMDNVATKMGTFAKNLGSGLKSITSKVGGMAGLADDGAKSLAAAGGGAAKGATSAAAPKAPAPKKVGFFGKLAGKAKGAVTTVASKAKNVVVKGATAVSNVAGAAKGAVVKGASAVKKGGVAVAKKAFKVGVKALGGAAKVGKVVVKSPFLAPIVEGIFTYKDITKAIEEYKQGEIDKKELDKKVGTRSIKGIGGIIGAVAGGTLGAAALGTLSFGLAAPLGAILGGIGGDMAGRFVGGVIADVIGDKTDKFGEGIVDSNVFKNKMMAESSDQAPDGEAPDGQAPDGQSPVQLDPPIPIEDGIITKAGQLIKPHAEDFLYAMKDGGPLVNAMAGDNKATEKNNELLSDFKANSQKLSVKQIELLEKNNSLLTMLQSSIVELNSNGGGSNPSSIVSSSNSNVTNVNFKSPGLRDIQLSYG